MKAILRIHQVLFSKGSSCVSKCCNHLLSKNVMFVTWCSKDLMPNVSVLLSAVCPFVPVRILSSLHGGAGLRQPFPALFCIEKKRRFLENKQTNPQKAFKIPQMNQVLTFLSNLQQSGRSWHNRVITFLVFRMHAST